MMKRCSKCKFYRKYYAYDDWNKGKNTDKMVCIMLTRIDDTDNDGFVLETKADNYCEEFQER